MRLLYLQVSPAYLHSRLRPLQASLRVVAFRDLAERAVIEFGALKICLRCGYLGAETRAGELNQELSFPNKVAFSESDSLDSPSGSRTEFAFRVGHNGPL